MIIGHLGLAFAAKRPWGSVPLLVLVIATFAPDILRESFARAGMGSLQANLYSHVLPWSAIFSSSPIIAFCVAGLP